MKLSSGAAAAAAQVEVKVCLPLQTPASEGQECSVAVQVWKQLPGGVLTVSQMLQYKDELISRWHHRIFLL